MVKFIVSEKYTCSVWDHASIQYLAAITFSHSGMRMECQILIQKDESSQEFAPNNIGVMHISHPKIWDRNSYVGMSHRNKFQLLLLFTVVIES